MMAKTAGKGAVIADVSVPLFKVAAQFTARGPLANRTAIAGVRVQHHPKGGVLLIGTDGHRMMVIHDVKGRCKTPMTLETKAGLAAVKTSNGSRWEVRAGKSRSKKQNIPCIQEDYPEWENVPRRVQTSRGGSLHAVNPKYLADFARAAAALQDVQFPSIRIVPGKTSSDAVLFMFPRAPHAFGVLMPMHEGTVPAALPHFWLKMNPRAKKGRSHA
jgi:hypothetical protein